MSKNKLFKVFGHDCIYHAVVSIDNNVPVYCGEFRAGINCFSENRGGEQWVSDVIDICFQYGINFNYHTYHENSFGLYTNSPCRLQISVMTPCTIHLYQRLQTVPINIKTRIIL